MDIWCEFQPTSLDMCKLCSHRQSLTRRFFKPTCAVSSQSTTTPEPSAETAASTSHTKKPLQPAQSSHNYQTTDNDFIEETVNTEIENLNQPNFTQFDTDQTPLDLTDSVASTSVNTNTSTICQACDTSIDTSIIPIAESTPIQHTQPQTQDSSTSPTIKHDTTFSRSLSLPIDTPLSAQEERLTTH